jgi:hypothetical protein
MKTTQGLNKGMGKGKGKFDAADFFSAEALSRLAAFSDHALGTAAGKGLVGTEAGSAAGEAAVQKTASEEKLDGVNKRLDDLVKLQRLQLKKPAVVFEGSDIGGTGGDFGGGGDFGDGGSDFGGGGDFG